MPGCSSIPVISPSRTNRARLSGSSARSSRIVFSATSRPELPIDGPVDQPQAPLGVGGQDLEPGRRLPGRGRASRPARSSPRVADRVARGDGIGDGLRDVGRARNAAAPPRPRYRSRRGPETAGGRSSRKSACPRRRWRGAGHGLRSVRAPRFPEDLPERPRGVDRTTRRRRPGGPERRRAPLGGRGGPGRRLRVMSFSAMGRSLRVDPHRGARVHSPLHPGPTSRGDLRSGDRTSADDPPLPWASGGRGVRPGLGLGTPRPPGPGHRMLGNFEVIRPGRPLRNSAGRRPTRLRGGWESPNPA